MSNVRFIDLDVHTDSVVMSVAETGAAEAKVFGTFPNDVNKVLKQLKKLSEDVSLLRVCYEAGPTGFGLCRRLKEAGIDCIVVAPSLVPQKAGLRVKTDRRDSKKLAHYLRSGDLTQVWVPDEQTEALRDLERARDDAKNAERTAVCDEICVGRLRHSATREAMEFEPDAPDARQLPQRGARQPLRPREAAWQVPRRRPAARQLPKHPTPSQDR